MLKGVIFDLDGTLGDTLPVCFAAFRRVFQDYLGVLYTDLEIRSMFGPTEEGILEAHIPVDGRESMDRYLQAYAGAHDLAPEPFPGIRELLDNLADRSVQTAVVTGKGPQSADLSLRAWGLEDRFTYVEAGAPHGNIKEENMAKVLREWGIDATHVVSVGDAPSDVTAARVAGIPAAGAAWASTADAARLAREQPDAIFTTVGDFASWLLER